MGDATFQSQVLVRPSILQSILAAGYTVLWTDSDMVWLGDPLPLLPDVNERSSVSRTSAIVLCRNIYIYTWYSVCKLQQ